MLPPRVLRLKPNVNGRDFAATDIHGNFSALKKALKAARFDPKNDRLLCSGDLVDRGPDSFEIIDFLSQPCNYSVPGNHEQMCLDRQYGQGHIDHHETYGGEWYTKLTRSQQMEVNSVIEGMPIVIEVEHKTKGKLGFVHAEIMGYDWNKFTAMIEKADDDEIMGIKQEILWNRDRIKAADKKIISGLDMLIVGHSSIKTPTRLGNTYYIDTGAGTATKGHVSLLCIDTMSVIMEPAPLLSNGWDNLADITGWSR